MSPRRANPRRTIASTALALALVAAPAAASSAATQGPVQCPTSSPSPTSPGPTGVVGITAVVCGPSAPATGTGSSNQGSGSTGLPGSRSVLGGSSTSSGSIGAGGGGTSPSSVQPLTTTPVTLADAVDLGGILSVGGLSTSSAPTVNPFGGDVQMWFTVWNTSKSPIDLTADFWMENALGMRLATVDAVALTGLKPGETRTVSAELPGAGQWTVLTAHARVNPPAEVDGTELSPLTRDATVFVLPWLIVLLVGAGAAAAVVVMIVRRAALSAAPAVVGA